MKKIIATGALVLAAVSANAAGFGIYEASARGNAMGGALIGDSSDATANYYNPANIAFATNIQLAAGVSFINPFCDIEVDHERQTRMDPGWFTVPTFYATIPLPWDFAIGWGNYTEYGLGTHYAPGWALAADTQQTTMEQITMNPNLAWKACNWMSVSAGLRASWISFENHKQPFNGLPAPLATSASTRLRGEDWAFGWNAGLSIKPVKDVTVGLVYRSRIRHNIRGHFDYYGSLTHPLAAPTFNSTHGRASARLTLPDSLSLGVNWDVTKRYRVGLIATWTHWSTVKEIDFRVAPMATGGYRMPFHWKDTIRAGVGMEYDLFNWMSVRCGYTFDEDPSKKHLSTTMLPAGDRHIIGSGLGFKITDSLRLDLGYSFIRMNNVHYNVTTNKDTPIKQTRRFSAHNGYSHIVSATLAYSF